MSKGILLFSTRATRTLVVLVVAFMAFVAVQPMGSIVQAATIERTALSQATLADLQAQMALLNARWQKFQEQQRITNGDSINNTEVMSHTMPMADTMGMTSTMPQGAINQDEMRQLMQMMNQMNQMMSQMQTMVASDTGGMSVMPMSDTNMSQMPQTQMMCGGMGATSTGGMGSMCGGGGGMMGGMGSMCGGGGGMMGGMGAVTGSDGMTTGGMDMMGPMMDMMSQMMGAMGGMMGAMSGGMQSNTMGGSMSSNTMGSASPSDLAAPVAANILTQTAIIGTVMVAVKPVNLTSAPVDTVDFAVTLEGDAAALAIDLTQVAKLQIDDQEVSATTWEPSDNGEQMVRGLLRFPATDAEGNSILSGVTKVGLVFRNLAGENQQTFTWNLTRP